MHWVLSRSVPEVERILLKTDPGDLTIRVSVVQNWYEEFRDREQD